jgi:hypothetical protein
MDGFYLSPAMGRGFRIPASLNRIPEMGEADLAR